MPQELYFASPSTRSSSLWVVSSPNPRDNTQIATCTSRTYIFCVFSWVSKSHGKQKNVKSDLKQPLIRFSQASSTRNQCDITTDIGPTPVLRSSTRSHVRDQIGMPSLKKNALTYHLLIFVTCYLLQVCHFNWFGRVEDFPINQCGPQKNPKFGSHKHLARLAPAKMLRSGQIVKAALGFFALKSQRMLTVRAWFWCFEIWVIWKDKRILILQSLNHMTHACLSCNKPPKDKNSLFCWGWPIWLFILRSAMVPSVHWDISNQILLPNKKSWRVTYEVDSVDTCDKLQEITLPVYDWLPAENSLVWCGWWHLISKPTSSKNLVVGPSS